MNRRKFFGLFGLAAFIPFVGKSEKTEDVVLLPNNYYGSANIILKDRGIYTIKWYNREGERIATDTFTIFGSLEHDYRISCKGYFYRIFYKEL